MLQTFLKEMLSADDIIGHNSDRFDIKWVRTRCLYHGLECPPDFVTLDTLKLARGAFNFNSNRLDYIAKFLGLGQKMETGGFKLWKAIVLDSCDCSLKKMIKYCKRDVVLLEKIYDRIKPYVKHKMHRGVFKGLRKISCPECTSYSTILSKTRVTAKGIQQMQMKCSKCGKYFSISNTEFKKSRG